MRRPGALSTIRVHASIESHTVRYEPYKEAAQVLHNWVYESLEPSLRPCRENSNTPMSDMQTVLLYMSV